MKMIAYCLSLSVLTASASVCPSTSQAGPPCCASCPGCTVSNNAAYHFDPTGNNPNIPRGLVGSGYYGAYSPDSYYHTECVALFGAGYPSDAIPSSRGAITLPSGSYQTGQAVQTQTTYYRPTSAPQPAVPARAGYGWW